MEPQLRVVKIGEDGSVTFRMPDMVGQYLVIEQQEGQIVLSPYDLRWETPVHSIAKIGQRLHCVTTPSNCLPEA